MDSDRTATAVSREGASEIRTPNSGDVNFSVDVQLARLMSPKFYSPIDQTVRGSMRRLYSQLEALKKKLKKESVRRTEAERVKYSIEQENLEVKVRFLEKLERVEKELVKYREEFTVIEQRNDWLESMRERFEGEADVARLKAVDAICLWKGRNVLAAVILEWHHFSVMQRVKRQRMLKLQGKLDKKEMIRGLDGWKEYMEIRTEQKLILMKAFRWRSRIMKKHVIWTWKGYVAKEKKKRNLLLKLMIQKGQFLAKITFTAWKEYTLQEKLKYVERMNDQLTSEVDNLRDKGMRNIRVKVLRRRCLDIFRGWLKWQRKNRRLRIVAATLASHDQIACTRLAWTAWREYVTTSKKADIKSDMAVNQWNRKLMSSVFSEWKSVIEDDRYQENDDFVNVLLEEHISLRTGVAKVTMATHEHFLRQYFGRWRKSVSELKKYRVILTRAVSTIPKSMMIGPFEEWVRFWRWRKRKSYLLATAEDHKVQNSKLKMFRNWQYFIFERRRTRLLSQKVVLDLQTKSLVRAFDSMGMNVEDRKRAQEEEMRDIQLRHEDQYQDSSVVQGSMGALVPCAEKLGESINEERKEWEGIFNSAASDYQEALDIERGARRQVEDAKKSIMIQIQELNDAKYADRFTLRRDVDEKLNGILNMLENLTRMQVGVERKLTREVETLRRAIQEDSTVVKNTKDLQHECLNVARRTKGESDASHSRLLNEHESETRLARDKHSSVLQSLQEIEDIKEGLVRDHKEFEAWIKEDSKRAEARRAADGVSDGASVADTISMYQSEDGRPQEDVSEEKMKEMIEETRKILEERKEQGDGKTDITDEEREKIRSGLEEEPEEVVDDTTTFSIPAETEHPTESAKEQTQKRGPGFVARPTEGQPMNVRESGTAFFVRPDRVPVFGEGDNRRLEIEVLRLRRKFEKQERGLRHQFGEDLAVWRRRYEHAVKVLMEVEDWKAQFEAKMKNLEELHTVEISDERARWEEKLDRVEKMRYFYEDQLKASESKAHDMEEQYTKEVHKLADLVRYYETTFGVMTIGVVTEMGKKMQRERRSPKAHTPMK